jgi:DNA modification methylase
MMIPERFATGMIDKLGWCLRNYVSWVKPNAMPESAKSRLTISWERVFWFTKRSEGYYFDTRYEPFATDKADVERQGSSQLTLFGGPNKHEGYGDRTYSGKVWNPKLELGGIMRDVWIIPTKGYEGQHFATYPIELCKPAIEGCCPPAGGIVMDCFMSSGTTGLAALQLGRNFIGIDISHEFCHLAVYERLSKQVPNTGAVVKWCIHL